METRYYTSDEGVEMKGKMVQCDEVTCTGKPCRHMHDKPHLYDDKECFSSCQHPGHHGICFFPRRDCGQRQIS